MLPVPSEHCALLRALLCSMAAGADLCTGMQAEVAFQSSLMVQLGALNVFLHLGCFRGFISQVLTGFNCR